MKSKSYFEKEYECEFLDSNRPCINFESSNPKILGYPFLTHKILGENAWSALNLEATIFASTPKHVWGKSMIKTLWEKAQNPTINIRCKQ